MNSLPRPRRGIAARLLATVIALPILAAACSGGSPLGGGGGDPASVVKEAMTVVQSKDLAKIGDLACAAKKDEVVKSLDFSSALGEGSAIDSQQVLDAMSIDTSKVTVGQPTITGDTATVPVTGSMTMTVDPAKMKPIVKAQLEAQGLPADDAAIDAMMGMVGSFTGQPIPMDETMTLVKENGAWKICE
jgi:hypothetical protein